MRFTLLNNGSTLSNDDLWREFLPVTWHGFELRRTPFNLTIIYDLLRVRMQVAFNRTVYDTETRSDFYILDYSQMIISFNPLGLCFLLLFTIFDILQNVINCMGGPLLFVTILICRTFHLTPQKYFVNGDSRNSIS